MDPTTQVLVSLMVTDRNEIQLSLKNVTQIVVECCGILQFTVHRPNYIHPYTSGLRPLARGIARYTRSAL